MPSHSLHRSASGRAAFVLLALFFFGIACEPAPAQPSPDQTDAGAVDGGTALPLRVLTWNLGDFAASEDEIAQVKAHLVDGPLNADVIAVQEIADAASFTQLLAALPGWSGALADEAKEIGELRVGVLWNPATVEASSPEVLFADAGVNFPRSVLRLSVHHGANPWPMYIVHLKAGIQADDETRRIAAVNALVASAAAEGGAMILGDFNEAISDPRAPEFFGVLTDAGYEVPTLAAADAGQYSYLPAKLLLDHVALHPNLPVSIGDAEAVRLDSSDPDFATAVSDHVPVIVTVTPEP